MARPSFKVHYLIFCTSVEYPNVQRPQRSSTLNGIDFVLEVPHGTEFPFVPDEFWLFARFSFPRSWTIRISTLAPEQKMAWYASKGS
jgi:hypothetical protein